jgi:hypothetical protein
VTETILFYAGFFVFILLFSEELARALAWLRVNLKRHPRYRIIAYPLMVALLVGAGIMIATSLIKFATTVTFSYE